jgi:hypothetical protein
MNTKDWDNLKKNPTSNRIVSFAMGVIVALGYIGCVPDDVTQSAKNIREDFHAARMAVNAEIRETVDQIYQNPDVTVDNADLLSLLREHGFLIDARYAAFEEVLYDYLPESKVDELFIAASILHMKYVDEIRELAQPQMSEELKARVEKRQAEIKRRASFYEQAGREMSEEDPSPAIVDPELIADDVVRNDDFVPHF